MQTSMKKYILFPVVLVALVLSSNMVKAQAEDVANPLLQYINKDKGIRKELSSRRIFSCDIISTNRRTGFIA